MKALTTLGFAGLLAGAALMGGAEKARAQVNPQVYGGFGAEDGYNDDGIGWGPAYRPETTFRPSYGFYGGVERPYPYARALQPPVTGSIAPPARQVEPRRRVRGQTTVRRRAQPTRRVVVRPGYPE